MASIAKKFQNETKNLVETDTENESEDEAILPVSDSVNATSIDFTSAEEQIPVFKRRHLAPNSIYESLDYEVCENKLYDADLRKKEQQRIPIKRDLAAWFIFILIGILTALVACCIDIVIEELSFIKYNFLKKSVDYNVMNGDLAIPYLYWVLLNVVFVAIGSYLVTYIEPVAIGSGIPLVKCYLNGVKVPRIVRIRTLFVKAIGVATSVIGGLAGGKEGPMVHSGAIIGAGISQGKSTTFKQDLGMLKYFRDDHAKRDFVLAGASAGVAAAFGAPMGGVLFSLEEASSFWNQGLIWQTLVASVITSFTLNVILSTYHGDTTFTYPGLFNLGKFEPLPFEYYEIPIFCIMGIMGGLFGALWIYINTQINKFRTRFLKAKWAKLFEACLVAAVGPTFACLMMFFINDCRPLGVDPTPFPVKLFCEDNEYNAAIALWFQTPESTVKALFHDPIASHNVITLLVFVSIYYPLSCITYGLSVSLGIFIPTLLVGAAWGRLTAILIGTIFPSSLSFIQPSKYALLGAAAQLGGVCRMTISLTVILIESTGNISFALPLIVTLICAKWMGDYFNEGIYDTQISQSAVPMLPWELDNRFSLLRARHIMSSPPICLNIKEKASFILQTLKKYPHNGFPVVDSNDSTKYSYGRLIGFILRSQLVVILKYSLFEERERWWKNDITIELFRDEYPRYPSIDTIKINPDKADYTVNLSMFLNPSPHSFRESASVSKIFQLFRALGLRHLVVTNDENEVVGIITRKDFPQAHH